jgi:hypothetical protein
MNTIVIKTQEDLKSNSFLSHRAFNKKPVANKAIEVIKKGINALISL